MKKNLGTWASAWLGAYNRRERQREVEGERQREVEGYPIANQFPFIIKTQSTALISPIKSNDPKSLAGPCHKLLLAGPKSSLHVKGSSLLV